MPDNEGVKKECMPKWFISLMVGIAITVISALIIAGVFALLDVFANKNKISNIEERMNKFEIKQDQLITSSNNTTSTLKLLVYQVEQSNEVMQELKATIKGSYAIENEKRRANIKSLNRNLEIAGISP